MLRETAERAGLESVRAPALLLATEAQFFNHRQDVYRPLALGAAMQLDGDLTDWPGLLRIEDDVAYAVAADAEAVWIAVQINNSQPRWHNGGRRQRHAFNQSDHVQLTIGNRAYRITAPQAGRVQTWRLPRNGADTPSRDARIRGYWTHIQNRSQIELLIPRNMLGKSIQTESAHLSLTFHQPSLPQKIFLNQQQLRYPPPALGKWLNALVSKGDLVVIDRSGLEVSRSSKTQTISDSPSADDLSLGDRIAYRLLVSDPPPVLSTAAIEAQKRALLQSALNNQPAAQWWQKQNFGQTWLAAAYPIQNADKQPVGAILIVQPDDAVQGFTNQALARLALITFLAFVAAALVVLTLAAILSWRIRRLSRAAENAVTDDGRFVPFKPSSSKDELGDLSRSFAAMLRDLKSYTDYLRDLASKLSHELRTPLAVVRSSLDNLEQMPMDSDAQRYAQRAREGALRLSAILTAMSAAKRMEQAIQSAEPETIDLAKLVTAMTQGYIDTFPSNKIKYVCLDSAPFVGMPELLTQALDKLVDNARDFCASNGQIVISLEKHDKQYVLAVYNDGPPLPEDMQGRLFDSMVSVREPSAPANSDINETAPHLGLGLYIVRLVAQAHGGHVMARNDASGVIFELFLPQQNV